MANIRISDLRPAGSEFFLNDEGFMSDLSDELTGEIMGGHTTITITPITPIITPTRPTLPISVPFPPFPPLPTITVPITIPVINAIL